MVTWFLQLQQIIFSVVQLLLNIYTVVGLRNRQSHCHILTKYNINTVVGLRNRQSHCHILTKYNINTVVGLRNRQSHCHILTKYNINTVVGLRNRQSHCHILTKYNINTVVGLRNRQSDGRILTKPLRVLVSSTTTLHQIKIHLQKKTSWKCPKQNTDSYTHTPHSMKERQCIRLTVHRHTPCRTTL